MRTCVVACARASKKMSGRLKRHSFLSTLLKTISHYHTVTATWPFNFFMSELSSLIPKT